MSTLVVAVPRSARRNLDLGLDKGVWGFPQGPPTMRQARVQDYAQLSRDDSVLITFGYTGGSPRKKLAAFVRNPTTGEAHRFDEAYLCRVNESYYESSTPFWPDEIAGRATYPHRIGIDPFYLGDVSLEPGIDLSSEVIDSLRVSLIWSSLGYTVDPAGSPALVRTTAPAVIPAGGQGFVPDADRRRAIEARAMCVACDWYATAGWSVTDVSLSNPDEDGTPYDLLCEKEGAVRHVEVKGSTALGDHVELTTNERSHAEVAELPVAPYLFVVGGIGLKITEDGIEGKGGDVRYHGPFDLDQSRFVPTRYRYTVPE